MIGTESKRGKASAYNTGCEKTNVGEILQASLKGSAGTHDFHGEDGISAIAQRKAARSRAAFLY
jgi:hypothetical protein